MAIRNKTVILVDDDTDDRFIYIEVIKKIDEKVNIIEFYSGVEFLDFLDENRPLEIDLVLIDMNMPKLNGLETVSRFKSNDHYQSTPTVMILALVDENLVLNSNVNISGIHVKTPSYNEFVDTLGKIYNDLVG